MAELKYLVDQVLSSNKDKFYSQKEIGAEVEKLKLAEVGVTQYSFSRNSIQPTVSKRLAELIKNGTAIKIGKKYAYKTPKNIHHIVRDDICSKVTFYKEHVFVMSQNLVAVPVNGATVSIAKELFRDYFGDDGLYDAIYIDNYLLLMLNIEAIDMSINEIADDLNNVIHDAKQFENNRQEIRIQLQHARVMKEIMKYAKMPKPIEPEQSGEVTAWDELDELYGAEQLDELDEFEED